MSPRTGIGSVRAAPLGWCLAARPLLHRVRPRAVRSGGSPGCRRRRLGHLAQPAGHRARSVGGQPTAPARRPDGGYTGSPSGLQRVSAPALDHDSGQHWRPPTARTCLVSKGWVDFEARRDPPEWKSDWLYPSGFWRGSDGIAVAAIGEFFPRTVPGLIGTTIFSNCKYPRSALLHRLMRC